MSMLELIVVAALLTCIANGFLMWALIKQIQWHRHIHDLDTIKKEYPAFTAAKELKVLAQRLDKFEADLSIFRGALKAMAGLEKQIKDYLRKRKAKK